MKLQPHDSHIVFNDGTDTLKIFNHRGEEVFRCEAQNSTVNRGFLTYGRCPRGRFILGRPVPTSKPAFGFFFTPLFDADRKGPMARFHRRGIGLHGGGTGLANPFAPSQGWQKTHGCLRLQNSENAKFVQFVRAAQFAGGVCTLDVVGEPEP